MANTDNALLARLNALKQSSVSLDAAPKAPAIDVQASRPVTVEDKLAERLKSLRSGSVASSAKYDNTYSSDVTSDLVAQSKDEVQAESHNDLHDWQQDGGDEQSLEELLAELGPEEQWSLDPEDPKHINSLLVEARQALPGDGVRETSVEDYVIVEPEVPAAAEEHSKSGEEQEEQDADEYVRQVLAQLEIEKKYGVHEEEEEEEKEQPTDQSGDKSMLDLPSTPSNLLAPPISEDSDLEARFAGLQLPSTPSSAPLSKKRNAQGKSSAPKYTDEDIDSWCCICNEDGELKCLGCDGDIYCQACWKDGHGSKPGQERGHRAIQYNKGQPTPG